MKNKCSGLFLVISTLLCACAANPTQEVVTNKNDGSFDVNVVQSATERNNSDAMQTINYNEEFSSTDGTVQFSLSVEMDNSYDEVPVAEVVPHFISEEDAKRVASILFDGATFYEAEPTFDVEYSREDLQNYIKRWLPYTSTDKLAELYGSEDPEFLTEMADSVKTAIQAFTQLSETSSNENPHEPCQWSFKSDSYYNYSAENLTGKDLSQDNEKIAVELMVGEIPYYIGFSKRDRDDFKLNYIYAYPHSYNSPMGLDTAIFRLQLCRTTEPSDEQISALKLKAQDMLDQMELGDWMVDECYVQTNYVGEYAEYVVNINAVPVINGVPAIRRPQLTYLKSEAEYASNYYLTDVSFKFSANGDLVHFELYSPVDTKKEINSNVATLTMDNLMEKAISHLSLTDYNEYGIGGETLEDLQESAGEDFVCQVSVCEMEYGMLRVKVPNTDESYYYVPGMILSGTVDYYGEETGTLYESSGTTIWDDRIVPLVALNAVDGSIIQLNNE